MKTETGITVDWEKQPTILVNPLKKKKLERHLILLLVGISICVGLNLWIDKGLAKLQSQRLNDVIKPEMSIKANEGKVAALLWMAKYYPDMKTLSKLESLIEQGSTEAMMIKAQYYYYLDKPLAISLINQAAKEGHPAGVAFLSDKKASDISFDEFFNYVFKGD